MEVELLEKIAKNTEHKTSFQIIVSDNETSVNTRFNWITRQVLIRDLTRRLSWIGTKYMK